MNQHTTIESSLEQLGGIRFNTQSQHEHQREDWLREIIGKEYANIEITPSKDTALYNDMLIYPMNDNVRLSPVYSNPIQLERLPKEPTDIAHDCYFAVVLLSGEYKLEQGGREVFLQPGEMSIYDATEPHKITVPKAFSKLIVSIPKPLIDSQLQSVEQLTATKLSSNNNVSFAASELLHLTNNLQRFDRSSFQALSTPIVEMMQSNLVAHGANQRAITRYKAISLLRVKNVILTELDNESLDAQQIAEHVRLSVRYINELFQSENTSVMRFVTEKRLERSRQYLANSKYDQYSITDIALRCGFKNCSHFSRVFKESYQHSPRAFRQLSIK